MPDQSIVPTFPLVLGHNPRPPVMLSGGWFAIVGRILILYTINTLNNYWPSHLKSAHHNNITSRIIPFLFGFHSITLNVMLEFKANQQYGHLQATFNSTAYRRNLSTNSKWVSPRSFARAFYLRPTSFSSSFSSRVLVSSNFWDPPLFVGPK